ncbi:MFS transporter [Desulfovibrio sp. OttesenSCG-928-C14]|nr:MFS transporter [Desulfovibrio sp. OttesenSCG-928-C14]
MFPRNRWCVLAIVSSALLLITVDMTVLYTALPTLTHDLAATASEKLWIVNAYALVVAGLLPGLGTLGDKIGHRRMFMAGLLVFGLASLLAAFAPTAPRLIMARIILGAGAAMMMPATLSIIRMTFTDSSERALALGVWGAISSGGAALGPVLGGILLEHFHWGAVFLVNLPVLAAAFISGALLLPKDRIGQARPWSPVSSLLIMIGLVGVTYAIKESARPSPSPAAALAALAAGCAALALFIRAQRKSRAPLIDFSLFRDRVFSHGVITALLMSLTMIGVELALSQRFQLVNGLSPLRAGLAIIPLPLAAFVAGPLAGLALPRLGARRILFCSLALAAAGLAGLLLLQQGGGQAWSQSGGLAQGACIAILGLGAGASMSVASISIMDRAPARSAGMAASIEEVSYELGGALGIAVFGSILSAVYTASLALPPELAPLGMAYDSLDAAILAAEALPGQAAATLLDLARASFDKAFAVVLAVGAALSAALAAFFLLRGGRKEV